MTPLKAKMRKEAHAMEEKYIEARNDWFEFKNIMNSAAAVSKRENTKKREIKQRHKRETEFFQFYIRMKEDARKEI